MYLNKVAWIKSGMPTLRPKIDPYFLDKRSTKCSHSVEKWNLVEKSASVETN